MYKVTVIITFNRLMTTLINDTNKSKYHHRITLDNNTVRNTSAENKHVCHTQTILKLHKRKTCGIRFMSVEHTFLS